METRKINFTVEIDDNDYVEAELLKILSELLGASIIDYQVLTDTKDLYQNDSHFRAITKKYKEAKKVRNDYINSKL